MAALDACGECPDCGLLQHLPVVEIAALITCERCGATLRQARRSSLVLCGVCAGLGLVLFVLALFFPLAAVWMSGGRFATSDLWMGPEHLRAAGAWVLALAVVSTLLVLPFSKLVLVLSMSLGVFLGATPRWLRVGFTFVPLASQWAMLDVFLLGAMIALFRLEAWMLVTFGPALFALGGAALCSIGVDAAFDEAAFWERVKVRAHVSAPSPDAGVIGCRHCGLVARSHEGERCARCERTLRRRKPDSVQRTWALVGAAALLAIPANVLPVMTIVKLGRGGPSTILGGTVELAQAGLWGLAAIVFMASILVPLVKLTGLSVLLVTTQRSSTARLPLRTRLFRLIALIGRWSMVDVFATMMLVTLARFGWLGRVLPDAGASAFCAVVVLTMFASESFDPRLMWDAAGRNQPPLAVTNEGARR